jgi:hypothetical protein
MSGLLDGLTSFFASDAIFVVAVIGFLVLLGALKWGAVSFGSRYGGVGIAAAFVTLGLYLLWAGVREGSLALEQVGGWVAGLAAIFLVLEVFIGRHQYHRGGRSDGSSD